MSSGESKVFEHELAHNAGFSDDLESLVALRTELIEAGRWFRSLPGLDLNEAACQQIEKAAERSYWLHAWRWLWVCLFVVWSVIGFATQKSKSDFELEDPRASAHCGGWAVQP
jgi:hypothetical protein